MLDRVVSACSLEHLFTWEKASPRILEYIESQSYCVIVPKRHLSHFRAATPIGIDVVNEEDVLPSAYKTTIARQLQLCGLHGGRASWLYQQFLKLEACRQPGKKVLIWDSDTIPLRPLSFVDHKGALTPFLSKENHAPYFAMIKKILGIDKQLPASFIAQSIPFYGDWLIEMLTTIESRFGLDWKDAILSQLTPDLGLSPFSEYETIGNYILATKPGAMAIDTKRCGHWLREGTEVMGSPNNLDLFLPAEADNKPFFVSFETWQTPFRQLKRYDLNSFLRLILSRNPGLSILQIGANDGINNDPLRPFLEAHQGKVVLVEALPYYCEKLNALYSSSPHVNICNALVSDQPGAAEFYFIDPGIADEMDGDGPPNKWAHGQGSLNKDTIIEWIYKNKFRGSGYAQNIDRYIRAITRTELPAVTLADIVQRYELADLEIILLDVQGHEYEILKTLIDLDRLPRIVIYEDDSSLSSQDRDLLGRLLCRLNYVLVTGTTDKVWIRL